MPNVQQQISLVFSLSLSLSLCFNDQIIQLLPGLAGTIMSVWILLELRVMEMVVRTGAMRRAELQSDSYHQQTNTQFGTAII